MIKTIVLFAMTLSLATSLTFAPHAAAQRNKSQTSGGGGGASKHLSTIVFAGIAGAVLGLSTLSFYGRPQEKLSHIALGAAIGVIGGTMYTTFKAATEPKDFYNLRERGPNPEIWNLALEQRAMPAAYVPRATFTLDF